MTAAGYREVGSWAGGTYPSGAVVVVGYNGKEHSRNAVAWAGREASLLDAPLVVLYAANYPGMTIEPGPGLLERDPRALEAARSELVHRFTDTAWGLAGGTADPPRWLHDAVAVSLSAFATEALGPDFGRSPEEVGESMARSLAHAVRGAVTEGLRADPAGGRGSNRSRIRSRRRPSY